MDLQLQLATAKNLLRQAELYLATAKKMKSKDDVRAAELMISRYKRDIASISNKMAK